MSFLRVLCLFFVLSFSIGCATTQGRKTAASIAEFAVAPIETFAAEAVSGLPDPDEVSDQELVVWLEAGGLTAEEAEFCVDTLRREGPCVLREALVGFLQDGGLRRPIRAYGEGAEADEIGQIAASRALLSWAKADLKCAE